MALPRYAQPRKPAYPQVPGQGQVPGAGAGAAQPPGAPMPPMAPPPGGIPAGAQTAQPTRTPGGGNPPGAAPVGGILPGIAGMPGAPSAVDAAGGVIPPRTMPNFLAGARVAKAGVGGPTGAAAGFHGAPAGPGMVPVPSPAAAAPAAPDYRAQADQLYNDLLGMNKDARGQITEMGQANIAALQRRNGSLAAMAGRGIGGGYLGGQRSMLTQGMNALQSGLLQNDQQRMDIMSKRVGDMMADARIGEGRDYAEKVRLAEAEADKNSQDLQTAANAWAADIKHQTGIDVVADPGADPELYRLYQAVANGGGPGAAAALNQYLVQRNQTYQDEQAAKKAAAAAKAKKEQKEADSGVADKIGHWFGYG